MSDYDASPDQTIRELRHQVTDLRQQLAAVTGERDAYKALAETPRRRGETPGPQMFLAEHHI